MAARLNRLAAGLPGEDTATILMEGPGGLIASADGCICAPGYAPLHGDRLEIIGSQATVVMDYDRVFLVRSESEAESVDLLSRYQECFDRTIRLFVEGVRGGTPFETDRLDNLETMQLMESLYAAAGIEVRHEAAPRPCEPHATR